MRRELFGTDWRLVARMVLAAIGTPLVVAAALVAVVWVAPPTVIAFVALASVVGAVRAARDRRAAADARETTAAEAPAVHAIVERLCLLADLAKPRNQLDPDRQPNSWIVTPGREHSRLHLTEGLLARLEPHELEAVIAHELAHVAHRDATVMTVVGGPGAVLLGGGLRLPRTGGFWMMSVGGLVAAGIGWLASIGTRALSRYREFAADAGAGVLTGRPAALASALMKVSEGVVAVPTRDLRAVAARDPFHLLPVAEATNRLLATHPPLAARIARLERQEARLQAARPAVRE